RKVRAVEQLLDRGAIGDFAGDELRARIESGEGLVRHHHVEAGDGIDLLRLAGGPGQLTQLRQAPCQLPADEAGAPGYDDLHARFLLLYPSRSRVRGRGNSATFSGTCGPISGARSGPWRRRGCVP